MDPLFFSNLTSPPLLFFFLGIAAAVLRSDLEIPAQVAKFLSLYLLFAIGFKGGVALTSEPFELGALKGLLAAVALSIVVPVYVFFLLKGRLQTADAAAIAATYGSVSAVTFVASTNYLDAGGIEWSGYMVAAMALMESPAIILGLLLYRLHANANPAATLSMRPMLRESLLNSSVFLVLGSLVIGWISGPPGMAQISPLVVNLFTGVLCLFLLDMGIVAARRLSDLTTVQSGAPHPALFVGIAIIVPLLNASLGILLALMLGLPEGDALLLTVLAASASYIAVPAAMRLALPEANPSVYLPMSLAVTFPLNLVVGIPVYHMVIGYFIN